MKKFGSLLMSTLLCASLLAGCGSSASVSQSTVPETISTAEGAIETGSEEVSLEEMTAAKTETSTEALEESSDDTVVRIGGLKGPTQWDWSSSWTMPKTALPQTTTNSQW